MAPDRCIVDSSVFVAFYREADALHTDAVRIMEEIAQATLVVHPFVIQETATVLTYGAGVSVATDFLNDIAQANNVLIPTTDIRRDMRHFTQRGLKLSFTDMTLISLAQETGDRLVTFDQQMVAAAKVQ